MKLQLIKKLNDKIFRNCFKYQNLSFLAKELVRANKDKNQQLVNNINDKLIDLRNIIIKKKFLKITF